MKNKIKNKINSLFEEDNIKRISSEIYKQYEELTFVKLSEEMKYIIEHYEGVMIKEGIGFRGMEISPFAYDGYEIVSCFLGFDDKYNLFNTFRMLENRLPKGMIPIAEMDGGNYICVDSQNKVYVWIHDEESKHNLFLVSNDFESFIESFEQLLPDMETESPDIISEYSEDFWAGL